jgi:hypothetical protein
MKTLLKLVFLTLLTPTFAMASDRMLFTNEATALINKMDAQAQTLPANRIQKRVLKVLLKATKDSLLRVGAKSEPESVFVELSSPQPLRPEMAYADHALKGQKNLVQSAFKVNYELQDLANQKFDGQSHGLVTAHTVTLEGRIITRQGVDPANGEILQVYFEKVSSNSTIMYEVGAISSAGGE